LETRGYNGTKSAFADYAEPIVRGPWYAAPAGDDVLNVK